MVFELSVLSTGCPRFDHVYLTFPRSRKMLKFVIDIVPFELN